jgi:hypothetical protein
MRQAQNRRNDTPSHQSVAVLARPGRTGMAICFRAPFTVLTLIGVAAWCQPAAATVCHVPAAVLCEGCVEQLSIRVGPGGACRISFTPATPAEQAGSAKFVDINIEAAPPRATIHRVSVPHSSVAGNPLRLRPACFFFNGRRFCE